MSGRRRRTAVVLLQTVVTLPQQKSVAAGQIVNDFAVLSAGGRRGSVAAIVVTQTEERSPEMFRTRSQFGRHRRQHRLQRRFGSAPAVDLVIWMDVDVVRAHARRTGNVGQTVVESKQIPNQSNVSKGEKQNK